MGAGRRDPHLPPQTDMLDRLFTKKDSIVFRQIGNEYVLVPICSQASDVDALYCLNDVGARIWELIDGKRTVSHIGDVIAREYEVDAETAREDVVEFVMQLMQAGTIMEAEDGVPDSGADVR